MKEHTIYSVELDGHMGAVNGLEPLSPEGYFIQPMIDDNGDKVVFWGRQEGETGFNIWCCNPDGTLIQKLTDSRAVSGHPFWSADGRRILFFSSMGVSEETEWDMQNQFAVDRAPRNLWIMDRDGGNRTKLTDGPYVDERPCMSPDGTEVVFVSNRSGHLNLWSVTITTGEMRQVTDHDGLDYRPIYSRDGHCLAFFSDNNQSKKHDLCLMTWPGGDVHWPVPPGLFRWIHGAFWLPDGDTILFHAAPVAAKTCGLWTLRLSDSRIEPVELPGMSICGHGSVDRTSRTLVFDSPGVGSGAPRG